MRTNEMNFLKGLFSKIDFRVNVLNILFVLAAVFFTASVKGQISPSNCTQGCTSNDVQIKNSYLSDTLGNKLPSNFVCPLSGTAKVFLTLELTTSTPRVGVSIFTRIKSFNPVTQTVGSEVSGSPISQCFGIALNQPTNKVTFTQSFAWTCGTPIVLTDVFIAWGTGNSNFCTGSSFQCPATPSKCFQLPPSNFIAIQTPNPQTATQTKCEETSGGGTAHFNLTQSDATIANGQNVIISGWYTTYTSGTNTFSGQITDSTNYLSGSGTVYAQVCDATHTTVCSPGTLTLTVNSRPAAAASGTVITCTNTTATLSGSGSATTGVSYLWSGSNTISNSTQINASTTTGGTYTLLVSNTTTGCTATATASVTVNTSPPIAMASGGTITCTNTSIAISGTGSTPSNATYSWSGPGIVSGGSTLTPTVNSGGTYTLTVTSTGNGCTASATASVSLNQSAPTAVASGGTLTCTNTSIAISGSGSTGSNATYSWSGPGIVSGGSTLTPTVSSGGTYTLTVTSTTNGCTASATASVSVNQSAPTFTITAVQPTLCTQYGTLTITPTVAGSYHFSIDNGATFPNTTGSFINLVSGSVSGVKIKNDANGCISSALACGASTYLPTETVKSAPINDMVLAPVPTVKAYPNPFNDHVKFVINAPTAGNGSLDIYNVMGQKVKTVYQGRITAGNNSFELVIPKQDQETLIYMFRVGNQKVTGKLLQLNR